MGSFNTKLSFYPDLSVMPSPEQCKEFLELDLFTSVIVNRNQSEFIENDGNCFDLEF